MGVSRREAMQGAVFQVERFAQAPHMALDRLPAERYRAECRLPLVQRPDIGLFPADVDGDGGLVGLQGTLQLGQRRRLGSTNRRYSG